jgi:hypothetical protein
MSGNEWGRSTNYVPPPHRLDDIDIVEAVLDLQRLQFIRSLLLNLAKESNHDTAWPVVNLTRAAMTPP